MAMFTDYIDNHIMCTFKQKKTFLYITFSVDKGLLERKKKFSLDVLRKIYESK